MQSEIVTDTMIVYTSNQRNAGIVTLQGHGGMEVWRNALHKILEKLSFAKCHFPHFGMEIKPASEKEKCEIYLNTFLYNK